MAVSVSECGVCILWQVFVGVVGGCSVEGEQPIFVVLEVYDVQVGGCCGWDINCLFGLELNEEVSTGRHWPL